MPQVKQRLQRSAGKRGPQHGRLSDSGVCLTAEGMEESLDACRAGERAAGTIESCWRGLKHLYEELPEGRTIRCGTPECWREALTKQAIDRLLEREQIAVGRGGDNSRGGDQTVCLLPSASGSAGAPAAGADPGGRGFGG